MLTHEELVVVVVNDVLRMRFGTSNISEQNINPRLLSIRRNMRTRMGVDTLAVSRFNMVVEVQVGKPGGVSREEKTITHDVGGISREQKNHNSRRGWCQSGRKNHNSLCGNIVVYPYRCSRHSHCGRRNNISSVRSRSGGDMIGIGVVPGG